MTREEWEAKQNSLKKEVKYVPTGNPGEVKMEEGDPEEPKVDMNKVKQDWNVFLDYLEKKGVRGKPALDTGNLGNKYFKEYLKANPNTSLNENIIPKIREAYQTLRNSQIADMQAGKATYNGKSGKDADYSGFMKWIVDNELTENPNYIGQYLTQLRFPGGKIVEEKTGRVLEKTNVLTPGWGEKAMKKENL
jgi:hypothetical protein